MITSGTSEWISLRPIYTICWLPDIIPLTSTSALSPSNPHFVVVHCWCMTKSTWKSCVASGQLPRYSIWAVPHVSLNTTIISCYNPHFVIVYERSVSFSSTKLCTSCRLSITRYLVVHLRDNHYHKNYGFQLYFQSEWWAVAIGFVQVIFVCMNLNLLANKCN